ncbi:MAG TPA: nucleotidyltransferase domain-containing protein [Candidatus Nanoarchaeia archaeon]|nr:nucleotidyltransferase domain-containing protein [Candidatus Nanoarchaeia archaeon]
MYTELSILQFFFDDPAGNFHIREIARKSALSHMTARKYLSRFVREGLLVQHKSKPYLTFAANASDPKYLNLKLYYNLERLRESKIISDLEQFYDYPVIVLFGSYAHASNTQESDIDIFILTNIEKEFSFTKNEKILQRKINLLVCSEKEFTRMKVKSPELMNNICNGITLSGKMEVL